MNIAKIKIQLSRIFGSIIYVYNFWDVFFLKLGFKKGISIIKMRDGSQFQIRPNTNDLGIILEFYIDKPYSYYSDFEIKNEDIVIDIGSNIGVFSVFASKKAINGKVFSFEPMPDNYSFFQKNIDINKITNIFPNMLAVTNSIGSIDFFMSPDTAWHSATKDFLSDITGKISVESTTLEAIVKKNEIDKIDFLKIDCEGGEYDILFNINDDILERVKKIAMECHPISKEENRDSLISFFSTKGFQVTPHDRLMLYAKKND